MGVEVVVNSHTFGYSQTQKKIMVKDNKYILFEPNT